MRQLRDADARQQRLEGLLVTAYRALPKANHLDSIKGIGEVTAAVLTASILDIKRFATPNKLVAYFGALPIEMSSGIDREGQPRSSRRYVMSKRGNDLVRRYLWMAALSAVQCNPAVRAVPPRGSQASRAQGDRHRARHAEIVASGVRGVQERQAVRPEPLSLGRANRWRGMPAGTSESGSEGSEQAAGHKPGAVPAEEVVTAACADKVAQAAAVGEGTYIDFGHVKQQLSMERVLAHLGLAERMRGSGTQRRCACPIHQGDGRSRTFSVNLKDNVFTCFDRRCGKHGDVIDLWAALHHLDLRGAAIDLIRTFNLEPAPAPRTEKRNG